METYISSPFRTAMKIPGLDLLLDHISDIKRIYRIQYISTKSLILELREKAFKPIKPDSLEMFTLASFSTPIHDGGGSALSYNYVEVRPTLFSEKILREGKKTARLKLIFNSSTTSYSGYIYQVVSSYSWNLFDPLLIKVVIELYVYGDKQNSRTLAITIDNETNTYTISEGSNIITDHRLYYPFKEVNEPIRYTISIIDPLDPGEVWNITGVVRLYYSLDIYRLLTYQTKVNGTYKCDLFSRQSWSIKLGYQNEYGYSKTIFLGAPKGGYILSKDMSDLGSNITLYLQIKGQVNTLEEVPWLSYPSSDYISKNTYAWAYVKFKICISDSMCDVSDPLYFDNYNTKYYYVKFIFKPTNTTYEKVYHVLVQDVIRGKIPITLKVWVTDGNLASQNAEVNLEFQPHSIFPVGTISYRPLMYRLMSDQIIYTTLYKCIETVCEPASYVDIHLPVYMVAGLYRTHGYSHGATNVGDITLTLQQIPVPGDLLNIYIDIDPEPTNPVCTENYCVDGDFEYISIKIDSSDQQYLLFSDSYEFKKYDPGPGASLPDIDLPGIIPAIGSIIGNRLFSRLWSEINPYLDMVSIAIEGYRILRRSAINDVSCELQNNGNAILCEWRKGYLAECSCDPIEIYINNVYVEYIDNLPPIYLKLCFNRSPSLPI